MSDFEKSICEQYSLPRTPLEFFLWVKKIMNETKLMYTNDQIFRSRTHKLIREEAYPISLFVHSFPDKYSKITLKQGNQGFDAETESAIDSNGSCGKIGYIEVTCIKDGKLEGYIGKHVDCYGFSPLNEFDEAVCEDVFNSIRDVTPAEIVAKPSNENVEKILKEIMKQIEHKIDISYPDNTVLLVMCCFSDLIDEQIWLYIVSNVRVSKKTKFSEIFIINAILPDNIYRLY